jgi:ATP-binding cassette subfamily B multidrug efflux pump
MSLRSLLRRHLLPYKRSLLMLLVLQGIQTAATLMLPYLSADLIDNGVLTGDRGHVWRVGWVMVAFALVQIVFAVFAVRVGARIATAFGRDVRTALFHQVTGFSAQEVGNFGAPSLITRITNDVQQIQMMIVMFTTMMAAAPITVVIGVILAVHEDVRLSVVPAVAVPIAVIVLGVVIIKMIPTFQAMQARIDRINAVLREQIVGLRVVRAFVREPQEAGRFAAANGELTRTSLRGGRLQALMFPTVGLVLNGSSIAVLWVGADRVASGDLAIGSLVAYLSYLVQILMSVMFVTFMMSMLPRASVAAERVIEVLDTQSSVRPPDEPITEVTSRATVELRDVSFAYPGASAPVLDHISFTTGPGQTTAIIGSTGSGKSTLIGLITRLFDATSGSVLVDGVDVRRLDPAVLWSRIGYVPQKAFLFSGTVASNLRFGRPEATDEELWTALEIAQAAGFVQAMPAALDSEINQGGTNVSGGQRQRLAIARALVVRPEIYLFDDAFSALDLATDARLRAAMAPRVADAAVIVVAQRVSTIRNADQIIVLEDGAMVGIGTHDELLETCPTYAEIAASQHAIEVAA